MQYSASIFYSEPDIYIFNNLKCNNLKSSCLHFPVFCHFTVTHHCFNVHMNHIHCVILHKKTTKNIWLHMMVHDSIFVSLNKFLKTRPPPLKNWIIHPWKDGVKLSRPWTKPASLPSLKHITDAVFLDHLIVFILLLKKDITETNIHNLLVIWNLSSYEICLLGQCSECL